MSDFTFSGGETILPLRDANIPDIVANLSQPAAAQRLAACSALSRLRADPTDGEAARPLKATALPALHSLAAGRQ